MKIILLLLLNQVVYVEKKANTLCFVYNSPVVNVSQRFVKLSARASAHVRVLRLSVKSPVCDNRRKRKHLSHRSIK